ncbi:MAG: hypothetical protein ACFE68_05385 [Candidatus Hodarchaeota archaeon]
MKHCETIRGPIAILFWDIVPYKDKQQNEEGIIQPKLMIIIRFTVMAAKRDV